MHDSEIKRLKECLDKNYLCAINRDMIDYLTICGFPLSLTENLVLIANVYNFDIDGYKIMRTQDITEVFCGEEEKFNEMIIKSEKIYDSFRAEIIDISGLKSAFNALMQKNECIIVQCEGAEESLFYEGMVTEVGKGEIVMKTFDVTGVWDTEPAHIPLNKITSIS